MSVDQRAADYNASVLVWQRCRDVIAGSDAVKSRGPSYLPPLAGGTVAEYDAYRARALFYGATGRTAAAFVGAIFRRDPTVHVPAAVAPQLEDVTLADESLPAMATRVVQETIHVGRCGVLVDRGRDGSRPYWVPYVAEQILNWRTQQIDGDSTLTLVTLLETVTEPLETDPWAVRCIEQIRVLRLVDGIYTATTFRRPVYGGNVASGASWVEVETLIPTRKGEPLGFIPFVFFGASSIRPNVEKPPLADLVDVNLSHYRTSADLESGRHYCAIPTVVITGSKSDAAVRLGPSMAWRLPEPEAKVTMLEFTGDGLQTLERALTQKQSLMASLGARLLETGGAGPETAEAVRLRHSGSHQALSQIAISASLGLTKLLRFHAWWEGFEPTAEQPIAVELNRIFFDERLTGDEVRTLVQMLQDGAMSWAGFFAALQKGGWARPGVDADAERASIEAERSARVSA